MEGEEQSDLHAQEIAVMLSSIPAFTFQISLKSAQDQHRLHGRRKGRMVDMIGFMWICFELNVNDALPPA